MSERMLPFVSNSAIIEPVIPSGAAGRFLFVPLLGTSGRAVEESLFACPCSAGLQPGISARDAAGGKAQR